MKKEENILEKIFTITPRLKAGILKSFLVSLIYESVRLIPIVLIKFIIDALVSGKSTSTAVIGFVGGIFVIYFILTLFDFFTSRIYINWLFEHEVKTLEKSAKKLLELHLGYHEKHHTGLQVSKITKVS